MNKGLESNLTAMAAEWNFLVALNDQPRPLKDPVEIQKVAIRLIGEHLQAIRVNYAQIDGDDVVVRQSYAVTVPPFTGRGPVVLYGKALGDCFMRGETAVVEDNHTDPR